MLLATWLAKIMLKLLILNNDKYKLQYTMNKIMEVKMKYKSVFFLKVLRTHAYLQFVAQK